MSESKTYIFGENQNGGPNGILGLLAPLLEGEANKEMWLLLDGPLLKRNI